MGFAQDERGQGTVEAAFTIPIIFLLLLLLIQPGIILYDYIVMRGAAVEACRLMATSDSEAGCRDFVLHRLAAIPQQDFFHVHDGECSWFVQIDGGENSGSSEVTIQNEVRPLPLIGAGLGLLGMTDEAGNVSLCVSWSAVNQPAWVRGTAAGSPADWVAQW